MEVAIIAALIVVAVLINCHFYPKQGNKKPLTMGRHPSYRKLDFPEKNLERFETVVRGDFRQNREELGNNPHQIPTDFSETLREISRSQQEQLNSISEQTKSHWGTQQTIEERMNSLG